MTEELTSREAIALRAEELAGGETGYVYRTEDPLGYFELVTEGRQSYEKYSACEDSFSRLGLEACAMKQRMAWCNRVDGGNEWRIGENLIRAKRHAAYAWRRASSAWEIELGDAVQVRNRYGLHTFIVTRLVLSEDGAPESCDHADWGQNHDPDDFGPGDNGPEPRGPSSRVYRNQPIVASRSGWTIGGATLIGRMSIMQIRARELGA